MAALQFWHLPSPEAGVASGALIHRQMTRRLVQRMQTLLASTSNSTAPLRPGQIAVLVRNHRRGGDRAH